MSSRAGGTASSPSMVGTSPFECSWQWHLRHYRCASAWFAPDLQLAAQQCDPLPHAGEAHSLDRTLLSQYLRRVESSPLIPHLKAYLRPLQPQCDAHRSGLGVPLHVIEGFLCDPEERDLYIGRQPFSPEGFLVADLPTLIP